MKPINLNVCKHCFIILFAGIISLKGSLDRETNPKHVFWVRSSDQGGHFCRSKVEVTVKDVDDNPPRFLKLHYEGKVEENGLVGVAVMKVKGNCS